MTVDTPQLIDPIPVRIAQKQKASTVDARLSAANVRREFANFYKTVTVTVMAQVVYPTNKQDANYASMGKDDESTGYLLVDPRDLQSNGIKLDTGDQILAFDGLDVKEEGLFIKQPKGKRAGQITGGSGFGLQRIFFADRNPVN